MQTITQQLFRPFIRELVVRKLESSGWPAWVQTEDDKDRYVVKYREVLSLSQLCTKCKFQKMGITLNKENIRYNPALRLAAKVCVLYDVYNLFDYMWPRTRRGASSGNDHPITRPSTSIRSSFGACCKTRQSG